MIAVMLSSSSTAMFTAMFSSAHLLFHYKEIMYHFKPKQYEQNHKGGGFMLENISEILTLKEVRQILKIGKNKALALVNSGELRAFKLGGDWRVSREELIKYLRRCG